jgi:biopolymer transport protein ExbD
MPIQVKQSSIGKEMNLTPMIDVVFLLLIFFLVESRFASEERSMPIELPNASAAVPMTQKPREIIVEIDRKGEFLLNRQVVTLEVLESTIRQAIADNPTTQGVIIRADRYSELQAAVTVIDLCARLGAEHSLVMQEPE